MGHYFLDRQYKLSRYPLGMTPTNNIIIDVFRALIQIKLTIQTVFNRKMVHASATIK